MKQIVEEWKTIEGYPNYEISNMGRCRNARAKNILKPVAYTWGAAFAKHQVKPHTVYCYGIRIDGRKACYSAGKLVAQHFVPNPNGYKQIRYKDGDTSNLIFTNIEWVKIVIPDHSMVRGSKKYRDRKEQIMHIERQIHYLERAVEYLKAGNIAELVYELYSPGLVKFAKQKISRYNELGEEFISFATDLLLDRVSRGLPVYYFGSRFSLLFKKFLTQKAKTVEFNDAINHKNEAI
jgi:hypothetical protein